MDIRTLIVTNLLLTLAMGLLVLLYRFGRRVPGFGRWGAGSLLIAGGFLALALRAAGFPVAASVLAVNAGFAFGATLRLDGVSLFIRGRVLPRWVWALPVAMIAIAAWFLIGQDNLAARTVAISVFLAGVTAAMAAIAARAPDGGRLDRAFAALNAAYALLLAARAGLWLVAPARGVFERTLFEGLFFLLLGVFEVVWTVCLLMMNADRIEVRREQSHRERLEAQAAQTWLQDVIARSLNEIYVFDATTLRFSFVNAGACRNLGYSLEELLALTPLDIKTRFDAASFAALVQPLRAGQLPVLTFETVHRRKDGSEYPAEVHLQLVDSGRGRVFLAVINDVTARTRAESRLRLDEARLESLLEISEYQSRSEQQLLDFALHKALALTASTFGYLYRYDERTRQFTLNTWSRGVMESCAVAGPQTVYDLDKTGIWGEAVRQRRAILVNDFAADQPLKKGYPAGHVALGNFLTVPVFSDSEIVAVVGVANKEGGYDDSDILQLTLLMASVWRVVERARAESELSARNAELERFIYTVSHDLKSPLVTITAFLGYLDQDLARDDQPRVATDLHYLRTAAGKMTALLDDVLELSRVGRVLAEPTVAGFTDLAGEAAALVAGAIAARGVDVRIEPATIALRGDRARFVEIWQNLVENAVKFMGAQPAPLIEVGAERREGQVVFFVRDNGVGIDPQYQERIFGLFERLDPAVAGTGLGLALVKRIVELYGGTIRVESAGPGLGSTFRFTLPGAVEAEPPAGGRA